MTNQHGNDHAARVHAPPASTRRTGRKRNGERGAALVETALVFPIFTMLLLGIISAAIAYGQSSSITNASREAARYGATLPVDGDLSGWLTSVADTAERASTGDLDLSRPGHRVCVAYVYPDGVETHDSTLSLVVDNLGSTENPIECFADGRPADERRVQVAIERPARLETGFWGSDITLSADATSYFERVGN